MMKTSLLALAGAVSVLAKTCPAADVSVIAHSGKPAGKEIKHDNSEWPPGSHNPYQRHA